jgi:hypothetical protein
MSVEKMALVKMELSYSLGRPPDIDTAWLLKDELTIALVQSKYNEKNDEMLERKDDQKLD